MAGDKKQVKKTESGKASEGDDRGSRGGKGKAA